MDNGYWGKIFKVVNRFCLLRTSQKIKHIETIAVLTKATAHVHHVKPAIFEASSDHMVPQPTC